MCDELQDSLSNLESWSVIIRNFGLLIIAVIALSLAIWRSKVAARQATAAQNQSETAQLGLLNERYQKGAEMLGSSVLSVRLGGIYALHRLAEDHPEQYHNEVMRLFCAFARHPIGEPIEATESINGGSFSPDAKFTHGWESMYEEDVAERGEESARTPRVREDVQSIMDVLRKREVRVFRMDLRGARLRFASLSEMNLEGAFLVKTDLSNATLFGASLVDADLSGAALENANLEKTNLSGARFTGPPDSISRPPATGLTQEQLDRAFASPDKPPQLKNCIDVTTDKQLVWRGHHSDQGV